MFGDAVAISYSDFFSQNSNAVPQTTGAEKTSGGTWADFNPGFPPGDNSQAALEAQRVALQNAQASSDVISTTTAAASVRNVAELQARIKASGGVLTALPNSSDYIVAVNNRLKFTVARNATGQFEIRESQNYYYLIGVAVLIGVLLLSKK